MSNFDQKELQHFLDHDHHDLRKKWKEISKNEIFIPRFDMSIHDQKQLALKRLKIVAQHQMFDAYDFIFDPKKVFANHEMAAFLDGSMATKLTVQYNLFGGTMATLGTERHRKIVEGVKDLSVIGCFALTELGYGNNAVEMETTAHYEHETQEFVINSPTTLSQKYFITNGALHANFCVVFAQLYVKNVHEGVHAILVRIREDDQTVRKGVFIEDLGAKFGLNGVDNARIMFNQVRSPREYLLNRYSEVDEQGVFSSKIQGKRNRFLKVADRLLSGRLCISSMSLQCAKFVLLCTLRYGNQRLTAGPSGKSDTPIAHFQLFQEALYPFVAKLVCLNQLLNYAKDEYSKDIMNASPQTIRLCCFTKPFITWNLQKLACAAVERCGGQGYISVNRICDAIQFAHSGITAEGVLMQKTAKELMDDAMKGKLQPESYKFKKHEWFNLNNLEQLCEVLLDLFRYRCETLITQVAASTQSQMSQGKSIYDIWTRQDNHLIQQLAHAFGHKTIIEVCMRNLHMEQNKSLCWILRQCLTIYACSTFVEFGTWFIIEGLVDHQAFKRLEAFYHKSIQDFHQISTRVVESFGIEEHMITSPMAQDYVDFNKASNKGEVFHEDKTPRYIVKPKL